MKKWMVEEEVVVGAFFLAERRRRDRLSLRFADHFATSLCKHAIF